MTEEEKKHKEDGKKFIKEHEEGKKLKQKAKGDEECPKKVAKSAQEKECTQH